MFSEASPSEASAARFIDEEIAFCGALLHDLGLVPAHAGENRFEVDGADAAREFCLKHQVAPERAVRVWEAIALHTSAGIASRMAAEIALVHLGAGLDFLGLGIDQVPPQLLEEILTSYPRLNFKSAFRDLLVEHCRRAFGWRKGTVTQLRRRVRRAGAAQRDGALGFCSPRVHAAFAMRFSCSWTERRTKLTKALAIAPPNFSSPNNMMSILGRFGNSSCTTRIPF
jgi:hypothetical protein